MSADEARAVVVLGLLLILVSVAASVWIVAAAALHGFTA